MKARKYWILVAMLVVCASTMWATNKTDNQVTFWVKQRDTLKGLQGVLVFVEDSIEPEGEKYGLTKQQLKTDVELRLRQNAIRLLTKEEFRSTVGPLLYVRLNIDINEEVEFIAYNIMFELYQGVFLERDPTIHCLSSTWMKGWVDVVKLDNIRAIREDVNDLVDVFSNDYFAVNPPKQPVGQKQITDPNILEEMKKLIRESKEQKQ